MLFRRILEQNTPLLKRISFWIKIVKASETWAYVDEARAIPTLCFIGRVVPLILQKLR